MGERRIPLCDLCGVELEIYAGRFGADARRDGMCYEFGYSTGGWGFRQNLLHPFSGEVCKHCFEWFTNAAKEFEESRLRWLAVRCTAVDEEKTKTTG